MEENYLRKAKVLWNPDFSPQAQSYSTPDLCGLWVAPEHIYAHTPDLCGLWASLEHSHVVVEAAPHWVPSCRHGGCLFVPGHPDPK